MKILLGIIIGGTIGFGVVFLGKCVSGVCPLTSNPIISSMLGAVLGAIIVMGR